MSLGAFKDAIINSAIYKGKSQTSLLFTIALAITPLIIDSMITDDSFICPKEKPYLISLMFLFGPAFCLLLLNLSFVIKYIREHDTHSKTFLYKKFLFRIFSLVILISATVGFSFLLSEHFVCLMLIGSTGQNLNKQDMVLYSREIGWSIIIGTLLFTFMLALLQLILYRPSYIEQVHEVYLNYLRRQSQKMLEESLLKLSRRTMDKKLEYIKSGCEDHIMKQDKSFVDVVTQLKQEQKEILTSRNDFKPSNMSLKEKIHFFSVYFDESLENKVIQL